MLKNCELAVRWIALFSVVIADDDVGLREEMALLLEATGIASEPFTVSEDLYKRLDPRRKVDILLLGGADCGEQFCANLGALASRRSDVGIIAMVDKNDRASRVRALLSGADACLPKPPHMPELIATMRALVRRLRSDHDQEYDGNTWQLSQDGWLLISPLGKVSRLTGRERQFMQGIEQLSRKAKTVPRADLIACLGEDVTQYDPHTIEAVLSRLRAKAGSGFPLKTIRGVGYTFAGRLTVA